MPKELAGRDNLLETAERKLDSMLTGYQTRPTVYYGLRGVGKTVILTTIESYAEQKGMLTRHIEVQEKRSFIKEISFACNAFTLSLSTREKFKDKFHRLVSTVKSFSATWNARDNTLSLGLDLDTLEASTAGSGDLMNDLTELFVALGKQYAKDANAPICFCVDELQYAKDEELEALIAALHRVNQLDIPIMLFAAGLPKHLKAMGDAKTYSERMFEFVEIDSLEDAAARQAIEIPAEKLGVTYSPEALDIILDHTMGYPYFIQEMCATIWELGGQGTHTVSGNPANRCIEETNRKLGEGFSACATTGAHHEKGIFSQLWSHAENYPAP